MEIKFDGELILEDYILFIKNIYKNTFFGKYKFIILIVTILFLLILLFKAVMEIGFNIFIKFVMQPKIMIALIVFIVLIILFFTIFNIKITKNIY